MRGYLKLKLGFKFTKEFMNVYTDIFVQLLANMHPNFIHHYTAH